MNGYIIDTFLSFWAFFLLALLYLDNCNLVKKLNEQLTPQVFALYFNDKFKLSLIISILPIIGFGFLLWRFASLLILAKMWGAGAVGLIIIWQFLAFGFIWLKVLIHLMLQPFGGNQQNQSQNKRGYQGSNQGIHQGVMA